MRLCIERVVWNKGYFRFDLIYRKSISASQTFSFFVFTPEVSFQYLCYERVRKKKQDHFFVNCSNQKETLGLLKHRRNKSIKQRNHHSIFGTLLSEKKGGKWNGSSSDRDLIDPISLFLRWKGKVTSIVEPYAMCKKCLYGCPILSFFYSWYSLSLPFAPWCEIEKLFIMLYHQGNDTSTC